MKPAGAARAVLSFVAVALMLAGAAVAAAFSEPRLGEARRFEPGLRDQIEPADVGGALAPPPAVPDVGPPWWVPAAIQAALVAVAIAVLVVLLRAMARRALRRRLRRLPAAARARRVPVEEPDGEGLLAAVDAGLAALSSDDQDPRRAVIACWLRLEEAAAAAGTPRHDSDTATDLVIRLLRSHRVNEPVLGRLAEVFLFARFATHAVDEQMRGEAQAALRRLREELAGVAGVR